MSKKALHYNEVTQSIRDLTRIYKPDREMARSFVTWFVKKYNVQGGFEKELLAIVLEEIDGR